MGLDLHTFIPNTDHRWVRIADTKPGNVIFTAHENVLLERAARELRCATVLSKHTFHAQTLKVVTDRGEIVLTPEHRLLVYMIDGKGPKWLAASEFKIGYRIRRLNPLWWDDYTYAEILRIEDAGEREVVDLRTNTGTFIANCFVSR